MEQTSGLPISGAEGDGNAVAAGSSLRLRIVYEKAECSRCGGTGHYSFNLRDGTVCYGCRGRKTALTRRGKAAQARVHAFRDRILATPARELRAGDRIYDADGRIREITEVSVRSAEEAAPGAASVSLLYADRDIFSGRVSPCWHQMAPEAIVVRGPTDEEWERIVAYARPLAGVTIEEVSE